MAENNVDKLKKIIEEKKKKGSGVDNSIKPDKSLGGKSHKAFISKKTGGPIDK